MIGGNPDTGPGFRTWNGDIDDVAMWDNPLGPGAAASIFAGGRTNEFPIVPEPGTGLLALMGMLGFLGVRRRR